MYRVCKRFRFEAAHQLSTAYSDDCARCPHGHSYQVELHFASPGLGASGMVIDFGELEEFVRQVKEEWDHALLLPIDLAAQYNRSSEFLALARKTVPLSVNPTAENMAVLLYYRCQAFLRMSQSLHRAAGVRLEKVRVWETETAWAEFEGKEVV